MSWRETALAFDLDTRSLPGPETIARRQLANGMVVLAREAFSSPSVVIMGRLPVGSLSDQDSQLGLAHLTASGLMRGTSRRDFGAIYESIEAIGASLSLSAGMHSTSFRGKALAEDLGTLLDLLAEVLTEPTFPTRPIERLKASRLTALAMRDQDTGSRAQMAFDRLAYPGHPYARPTDGERQTIESLKAADLRRFHRAHYGPAGAQLAVVGAVAAEAALQAVEARLGSWPARRRKPEPGLPPLKAIKSLRRKDVAMPGKIQSDLVLGVPGPSRNDPEFLAASLGNNILGRFGMFGRIGDVVRQEAGLAYYAMSSLDGGPGPGAWQVIAGVSPANVEQAIKLICQVIGSFVNSKVPADELGENVANLIGRLPLQLETNEGVAGALLHIERFQLGLDYYQRYPDLLTAITADQVLETARRFLHPDRLAIATAGPRSEAPDGLRRR
jgi:zinc protease